MRIAKVLIEHPVLSLDAPFDYLIPKGTRVEKGVRVRIPFNNKEVVGYVLNVVIEPRRKEEIEEEEGFELKEISEILDEAPILNAELMALAEWLAYTTVSPLIACFQAMLPPALKPTGGKKTKVKTLKAVKVINADLTGLTAKQKACLSSLEVNKTYIKSTIPYGAGIIKKLIETNRLAEFDEETYRDPLEGQTFSAENAPTLTEEQDVALRLIDENDAAKPYLLWGVTGSGKTEIYIRLAEKALKAGKNVLILVPEISLTPLMIQRFKSRLNYATAVFHSGISSGQRYDEYRRVARGEARLVIGARSAIFAPLQNIGLIVLDEEHSTSYKQDVAPCYRALDVALKRSETHGAKLVLGSATPSLESMARALKGVYRLATLKKRVRDYPLAAARIIDLTTELRSGNRGMLSRTLKEAIKKRLAKQEQVVLLLNKRGYAPSVMCPKCRYVFQCPDCEVPLKYHKDTNTLNCHYCGRTISYPKKCPQCGGTYLRYLGYGTQRVEEEVKKEFPEARVARMDLDSVKMEKGYRKLLEGLYNREYDILLGTQLVAKGLDFPNITLVGALQADVGLFNGNFRANEETFQLLTQALGRAGRGDKTGEAYIQTYNPSHFVIELAAKQDYMAFYRREMNYRRDCKYPPYSYFAAVFLTGRNRDELEKEAREIKKYIISNEDEKATVLGPSVPYIPKYRREYRMRLIYRFRDREKALRLLNEVKKTRVNNFRARITFDVDPIDDI